MQKYLKTYFSFLSGGLEKDITASQFVVPCFSESNDWLDIEVRIVFHLLFEKCFVCLSVLQTEI